MAGIIAGLALAAAVIAAIALLKRRAGDAALKVILIGVDGASWKVIRPMISRGRLPNMKALIEKGVSGKLETLNNLMSPAIWTSVSTGVSPEKHGILDFARHDPETGEVILYKSFDRRAKAFWNVLSENRKKTGVFNWLVSYPPEEIDGFMVSNYYLHGNRPDNWAYPEEVKDPAVKPKAGENEDRYIYDRVLERYDHELKTERYYAGSLAARKGIEVFAAYTCVLDHIQHYFWKFHEPERYSGGEWKMNEKDEDKYKDVIYGYYSAIDDYIGMLAGMAGKDTVVIVASDHGFAAERNLRIPICLEEILKMCGVSAKIKTCDDYGNKVYLNYLKTEEPVKHIKDVICGIRDASGNAIFEFSESGDKQYDYCAVQKITNIGKGSEICVKGVLYPSEKFITADDIETYKSGTHDYEDAVFMMAGGIIPPRASVKGVSVYDIAPTILYLMGQPVAQDMDGKPLTELIDRDYVEKNPVKYVKTYEMDSGKSPKEGSGGPHDEEYKKRLKALGYMQ